MDVLDFKMMPYEKQSKLIWDHAIFMGTRMKDTKKFDLYGIGDFFIEVSYNDDLKMLDFDVIQNDKKRLQPYTEQLSLKGLL